MKSVTAHFEFSGPFWLLVSLVIAGGFAVYFREELKSLFERLEQNSQAYLTQT